MAGKRNPRGGRGSKKDAAKLDTPATVSTLDAEPQGTSSESETEGNMQEITGYDAPGPSQSSIRPVTGQQQPGTALGNNSSSSGGIITAAPVNPSNSSSSSSSNAGRPAERPRSKQHRELHSHTPLQVKESQIQWE